MIKNIFFRITVFTLSAIFLFPQAVVYAEKPEGIKEVRREIKENKKDLRQDLKNLINSLKSKIAKFTNAQVTAVSGSILTISKDGKTYTVNSTSDTKLRRHFWGKSSLSEISVGDNVNVWGKWADDAQTTINAQMIRNLSVMKRRGVLFGTVKSTGSSTFVIQTINRGDQTVTVGSATKLIDRKEVSISFSDIKTGDRIRVKGLWDKTNSTITEVTQVKDFSIPATSTITPTATATVTPSVTESPTPTPTP